MTNKTTTLCLILFLFSSCGPSKTLADLLQEVNANPKAISYENKCVVNNEEGHIQGVQIFNHKKNQYYFFSGSSNNQSYYAIANAGTKKVLSVNKFLDDPYRHAGGFQIMKNLLAVGIEDNILVDKSKVLLYQIIDPEKPDLKLLKTIERSGPAKRYTAGCVAIAKQKKDIWIAVGNWDTKNIDFYSIPSKRLKDSKANFKLIYSFDSEKINAENWIEKSWFSYQNINLFKGSDRKLYLSGTAFDELAETEIVDIFEINFSDLGHFELRKVAHRIFSKPDSTTFRWGGGIFIDKKKGIKILSTGEHITDSLKVNLYSEKF